MRPIQPIQLRYTRCLFLPINTLPKAHRHNSHIISIRQLSNKHRGNYSRIISHNNSPIISRSIIKCIIRLSNKHPLRNSIKLCLNMHHRFDQNQPIPLLFHLILAVCILHMYKSLVVSHCLLLVLLMMVTLIIIMDHPLKYHIRLLNSLLIWLLLLLFTPIRMRQFPWSVASHILPLLALISNHTFNLCINRYSSAPSKLLLRKHNPAIITSHLMVHTKDHRAVLLGLPLIIIRIRDTRCFAFFFIPLSRTSCTYVQKYRCFFFYVAS